MSSGVMLRPIDSQCWKRWLAACVLTVAVAAIAAGCTKPQQPAADTQADRSGQRAGPASGSDRPVSVRVVDEQQLAELIASKRGKVVLVDFWATWCPTCMELFPHTVELYKELADKGLDVVSVSLDDPEEQPAVIAFLRRKGATFDNVISTYGGSNDSLQRFQIADGALPHYKLYDRQGTLRKVFLSSERQIRPEDLEREVRELIASPPVDDLPTGGRPSTP